MIFMPLAVGVTLQGTRDIGDMHFLAEQGGQSRYVFRHPAKLQFFEFRRLAPVVFNPLVEDVRADLTLDELEWACTHDLLTV